MGLFNRKKNPAKEKLKELTGGFTLSKEFRNRLKEKNLSISDGVNITQQIKGEIKKGLVDENNVEARLNQLLDETSREKSQNDPTKSCPECGYLQEEGNNVCIQCGYHFNALKITCPKCSTKQDSDNRFCIQCGHEIKGQPKTPAHMITFLYNQKHNLKTCPECGTEFLKPDNYCHSCGYKNPKMEATPEIPEEDNLEELEALYSKSVSSKYSPNFKFAYVIYLSTYGKRFPKGILNDYKVTEEDLKSQAIEDGFVAEASPLISARKSTVSELKDILKAHNLKVSGKKDELIERLGENLSTEELRELFPEITYSISEEGKDFVAKNSYVLFYHENNLKSVISTNEFEMIFNENTYSNDEEMYSLIINKLESNEEDYVKRSDYANYISNIEALSVLYKYANYDLKLLDAYFKLFIYTINTIDRYLDENRMNSLNNLLHSLSLDINQLKERFSTAYDDFKYPDLKISKKDSFTYLLKLFSGQDMHEIESEIIAKYFAFG